jgi:hypothetical protein
MRWTLALFLAGLLHAASSSALTAVTLDESRRGEIQGLNLNFALGEAFAAARAALLDPANFGPGGVLPEPIDVAAVPGFDDASLAGADLVIWNGGALDEAERAALGRFVACGGSVLAFHNEAAADLAPLFGADAGGATGAAQASVVDSASPVTDGPFGSLAAATVFPTGFAGSFGPDLGATGVPAASNAAGTLGASFTLGAGAAVVFADEEMFVSQGELGVAAALWSPTTETLFLNALAWLATGRATDTLFCVALAGKETLQVAKLGRRKLDPATFGVWIGGGRAVLIAPSGAGFVGDALDPKGKGLKFDVVLDPASAEDLLHSLEQLTADFDGGPLTLDPAAAAKASFKSNVKGTRAKLKVKQKLLAPAEGRKGSYTARAKASL